MGPRRHYSNFCLKKVKQLSFLRKSSLTTWHRPDELINDIYSALRDKYAPQAYLKACSFSFQHGPRSPVIGSQLDLKL